MAKELGVDLATLTGTGPDGRITRDDVLQASRGAGQRVPVVGIRRAVADRLTASVREIPQVTTWVDVDATELLRWRDTLTADQDVVRVTPLALVLRIAVAGLRRFPILNSSFDAEANEIAVHPAVHLGVGVQTDNGLVAPVVRDAHIRTTLDLAGEIARVGAAARDGALRPDELRGSTFTASNFGVFGVDAGTPIINPPEAAIIGLGRIADRPWVHNGELVVRKVMTVTLGFDHRVCDGREAAGYLRFVADHIEAPTRLLADL
jgi:2-oxoisovalerate dehydrogenase E2 component (dihydrolipoyl transacylase)